MIRKAVQPPNRRAPFTRRALAKALGGQLPRRGQKIGLLGGSFNPAHRGHRLISLEALKKLGLDEVWWLVSPQNPLKSPREMLPLTDRLTRAQKVAHHPRLRVSNLETLLGCTATVETLSWLTKLFPGVNFVWLMGADNLLQIDRWQSWKEIFHITTIAVFDRPTYSMKASGAKAAQRFARQRVRESKAQSLANLRAPAWTFLHTPLDALSATELRARSAVS
ncbi:nicotinate-nucleotide adenylyltransferase [Rhodovibrionaceae bacterium A322]